MLFCFVFFLNIIKNENSPAYSGKIICLSFFFFEYFLECFVAIVVAVGAVGAVNYNTTTLNRKANGKWAVRR